MNKIKIPAFILAFGLSSILTGFSANVVWQTPATITADTDISTAGTLVSAYNMGGTAVTLNGVTFAEGTFTVPSGSLTFGSMAVGGSSYYAYNAGSALPAFTALSANYQQLIQTSMYQGYGTVALTLSGLTPGNDYQVQFWINRSDIGASATKFIAGNTSGNVVASPGVGQFVIGNFTANDTTQLITADQSPGNYYLFMSAYQLRDLGVSGPKVVSQSITNDTFQGIVNLKVSFSEAVDSVTALNTANYVISGSATLSNGVLDINNQDVTFDITGVFGGDPYTLSVSGVKDLANITMVATNFAGTVPAIRQSIPGGTQTASSESSGTLYAVRDGLVGGFFGTIGGPPGGDWYELDLGAPQSIEELAVWFRWNCCNERSANVIFTVMDGSRNVLWTTNNGPNYVPNGPWLNNTNYLVVPAVMGQIIRLEHPAGNTEPIELVEVQVLGPSSGLLILAQPASKTVVSGTPASFTVAVSGTNLPITYQWRLEGTNLPGATAQTLLIPSAGVANLGSYSVVVTDSTSRQRTSAPALLSIFAETVPPTVVSQSFTFNRLKDELKLTVVFSEALDAVTATNRANYSVAGVGTLTNGTLDISGQSVTFKVVGAPEGCSNYTPYTLNVSGVKDLAQNIMVATNFAGHLPAIQHSYVGGTVTMSSIYGTSYDGPKARDGDLTTFANTSQYGNIQEWWELDFGTPRSIGELDVWFRDNWGGVGLQNNTNLNFIIMDGSRTPLWTKFIGADALPLGVPTNCIVSPPVMGQIVRIEHALGDFGVINLGEVLVAATPSSALPCAGFLPPITINRTPGGITLTWVGTATLQSSTNVAGPYGDVGSATSPYPITPTGLHQFYRTRQ
jgi:hypothetical protein